MSKIETLDKEITFSKEAEQSVLGCILLENNVLGDVASIVEANDFYYSAHQIIFSVMEELFKESAPIDILSITEKLKNITKLEEVGGYSYLASLASLIYNSENVIYYAEIVKEKSKLRKLISASNNIISTANSGKSVNEVLELAEKTIFDISNEQNSKKILPLNDVLIKTYYKIEENYNNKNRITGIDTGFKSLNIKTNGLQKTDLIIIGARPATGKTAFALNLALNGAKKGSKVAIFSLEMSSEQLTERLIAIQSKVALTKIKTGKLEEEEDWQRIINSISIMGTYEIYINDTAGISLLEIRSQLRKIKLQKGLDMVVIDYLQLMQSDSNSESRQIFISQISRGLKILAKELDIVIIALSQISRESEKRSNHKPMLSDLRESGAIEQDADVVMFLHNEWNYSQKDEDQNKIEVIIAKHRSGEIGNIKLGWMAEYQCFSDIEII